MFAAMSGHGPIVSELMKVGKADPGGCWATSSSRDIFVSPLLKQSLLVGWYISFLFLKGGLL